MDTLSLILRAVRVRAPLIADLRLGEDISIGLPSLGGLPFHYVVAGECLLDAGGVRTELRAGDFVMLARLPYYRLETGCGTQRLEVMDFAERDDFSVGDLRTGRDRLLMTQVGAEPPQARVLSAILIPAGPDASLLARDLPTLTLLRDVKAMLEPWLVAAIHYMSTDVREHEPGMSAVAERLVEVIFLAVLRQWLLGADHARGWMRGLTEPTISRALNALHLDPGKSWTLRELAVASGCSRSRLARLFHEVMQETPFAYLTRRRMHLAASMLARDRRSIAAIGLSLGYRNAQTFTHAFRAAFGETPVQFRRRDPGDVERRP